MRSLRSFHMHVRRLVFTVIIIVQGLLRPAAAQPAVHLSLGEALEAVDQTNLAVLLSREALAQAMAQAAQSRASLLPNVSLDATQRRARSASIGSTLARTGVSNRFDVALNGRLEVLDPQNIAVYRAAQVGVEVAELDVAATRESVLASVATTYFQHLRNVARREVLAANISRARALLELAERQADVGVATQIDVTRAQALVATAEQEQLQQETVVEQTALQLKRILAIPMERPLVLTGFSIPRAAPAEFAATLEQTAFEQRADYLRAQRLLRQNELEVRAAKFNRLPSLALQGSYGDASELPFEGDRATVWSAAAAVSLPVFDGMRTTALTRLALSRRRAQEMRVRDLEAGISAEVRLALQNARSRSAQVDVAERTLRLAEDELRLAQTRFEQGVADNREMIEAQNRLAQASDNRLEAVHQYHLSRLELERARGNVRAILP
jgi:outer membrane protein